MHFISLICFAFAAVCNAVMDRVGDPVAFVQSIFYSKDKTFWLKTESWRRKYVKGLPGLGKRKIVVFGMKTPFDIDPISDAWHRFKAAMIVLLAASAIAGMLNGPVVQLKWWLSIPVHLCMFGLAWNVPFNLCNNKLFKRK